jgi:hypothetical protein
LASRIGEEECMFGKGKSGTENCRVKRLQRSAVTQPAATLHLPGHWPVVECEELSDLLDGVADPVGRTLSAFSEKPSPAMDRGYHRPIYYFSDAKSDPRIIDKLAISDNQRRK